MLYGLFIIFQEDIYELRMILWYIVNILLFLSFLLFLLKAKKLETKSQKNVYLGYGLFSLLFGLTRLFFILSWLCGDAFEGCSDFYLILGYLIGTLATIIIIYILETYLLKTKKILTGITIIVFCIILIALFGLTSRGIALTMIYILLPVVIGAISMSYIYFIIKSTGTSRKKAIGAFGGLLLLFIGHFMNTSFFNSMFPGTPGIISPIIMSAGIIIFMITQLFIK